MNKNNSLRLFDQLSTEIIFEIFDYLISNDIIYTFFNLNQRLNCIILKYPYIINNFQLPINNIHYWTNLFPTIQLSIQCLIIKTIDISFSLDLFLNLKTLIISSSFPICCEQFKFIFEYKNFNKLINFKIKNEIFQNDKSSYNYKIFRQNLFEKIFSDENWIENFECLSELTLYNTREINHFIINKNIQRLSLKSTHSIDAFCLLKYTPNLKSFYLIITSFYHNDDLNKTFHLSQIQLERFSLTLHNDLEYVEIYEKNLLSLINLIQQFSYSLIFLSLNLSRVCICETNTFQFNGNFLQQQLLKSMIKLKQFHFYVKLHQLQDHIENILLTFKTTFWLNHHWTIGMHKKYLELFKNHLINRERKEYTCRIYYLLSLFDLFELYFILIYIYIIYLHIRFVLSKSWLTFLFIQSSYIH